MGICEPKLPNTSILGWAQSAGRKEIAPVVFTMVIKVNNRNSQSLNREHDLLKHVTFVEKVFRDFEANNQKREYF